MSEQLNLSFQPKALDYPALRSRSRIIIDGDPGSGKTTLAGELASALPATALSLDDYLLQDGRPYREQLQYADLAATISATKGPIVLEGVCLLAILPTIQFQHDFHIFTKLVLFGKWELEEYLRPRIQLPKNKLSREVVEYYRQHKPFTTCDLERTMFADFG